MDTRGGSNVRAQSVFTEKILKINNNNIGCNVQFVKAEKKSVFEMTSTYYIYNLTELHAELYCDSLVNISYWSD